MIRYMLRIPRTLGEPYNYPRRVVMVSLQSTTIDDIAELELGGRQDDIGAVSDTIFYRTFGRRGAIIEPWTSPGHLAAAMATEAMRIYEPVLLEGGVLFQPAEDALKDELSRLADSIASVLTKALPMLSSSDVNGVPYLLEHVRLILALCEAVCTESVRSPDGIAVIASVFQSCLAAGEVERQQLQQFLRASCEFLEDVILYVPQSLDQVCSFMHRLVALAMDADAPDIALLCDDLHSIWGDYL